MDTLTDCSDELAQKVLDAAFAVHRQLGPGLLESVFELALMLEISANGISAQRQVEVPASSSASLRVLRVLRGLLCLCLVFCPVVVWAEGKPDVKAKSVSYIVAGRAATVVLYGENLTPNSVKANKTFVNVKLGEAKATEGEDKKKGSRQVLIEIAPAANCPPENVELTLTQADGSKTTTQIPIVEEVASEIKEKKPNTLFSQAMPLPGDIRGVAINGNVEADNPSTFRFEAKTGEIWRFRVFAGRGGSPLDPVLRVRDSRHLSLGLAAGNAKNDLTLNFKPPFVGTYYLEIVDEQSRGGGSFFYRLTAQTVKLIVK